MEDTSIDSFNSLESKQIKHLNASFFEVKIYSLKNSFGASRKLY